MGSAGFCPSAVALKVVAVGGDKEGQDLHWTLEYHTLILFFLNGTIMKKSLYFFLPGYLKAQFKPYKE